MAPAADQRWTVALTADNYVDMAGKMELAAMNRNGASQGNPKIPALRLDDALSILDYFVVHSPRQWWGTDPVTWPEWYPWALCALGYAKKGDKFDYSKIHLWVTQECLEKIWEDWLPGVALQMDGDGMAKKPPKFAPPKNSYARWARVAKVAWMKLKKERGLEDPLRRDKKKSNVGWLLLIVAVGWWASKKG